MTLKPYPLTPERETELIEKIAKRVVDHHMEGSSHSFSGDI